MREVLCEYKILVGCGHMDGSVIEATCGPFPNFRDTWAAQKNPQTNEH